MSKTVTTRLPEKITRRLENISKQEHLDRAALIRKMLIEDIEEYELRKAGEKYRKGEVSVEEAANKAGVSLWKMVEYLRKENIRAPPQSLEELEEEFEESID